MPPRKKAAANSDLASVLAELRKDKEAPMSIGAFSDFAEMKPKGLPTGNLTLDSLTGIGGPPAGRISEFVGPPSSGKTTAAMMCAAYIQQRGGVVVYLDYERSLDPVYAEALGLDIYDGATFIYSKPDHFEQGANAFRKLAFTGMVDLGIHDSTAAMVTKHELEADTGAVQVADRAKMMHQYCLTPDHKVLREDLRWVPLSDCEVGDSILGFDEDKQPGSGGRNYRRAVVKNVQRQVSEDMYAVTLASGKTFRVTGNHKWLVGVPNGRGFGYMWRETSDLRPGKDYSPAILDTWEEDMSKDAGWLAGMFDGEGTLINRAETKERASGVQIVVGQKVGPEADRIERLLKEFDAAATFSDVEVEDRLPFRRFLLTGSLRTKMSFLGTVRPERLISKLDFDRMGRMQSWKRDPEAIVSVERIEAQEVIVMETSTGTFIADGYPMHNCRQLNPLLSRTGTGAIFINHLMEKVDTTPNGRRMAAQGIKQKTSPGGTAVPYYASLRIEFKQIGNLRTDEMDVLANETIAVTTQTKTQATVVKNKVGDPFRTAELRVRFGKGFSQEFSVFNVLVNHNVIKKKGAYFTYPPALQLDDDHVQIHGEDANLSRMEENPEWFAKLEEVAYATIEKAGSAAYDTVDASVLDEHGMSPEEAAEAKAVSTGIDFSAGSSESLEDIQ